MRFFNSVKSVTFLGAAAGALVAATPALADHHEGAEDEAAASEAEATEAVTVGGAEMLPSRTIVENAMNSPIHTTLVQAVQAAHLVSTLSGPGPFTVFAPTDESFALLPQETLTALMSEQGVPQLRQILTYHVLPGAIDAEDLMGRIEAAGGELTLDSVEGSPLKFTIVNDAVAIEDETGGIGYVTQADVAQSNGYIHVINNVLIPNQPTPQELAAIAAEMAAEDAAEAAATEAETGDAMATDTDGMTDDDMVEGAEQTSEAADEM